MWWIYFTYINFVISFISDLVLNFLSRQKFSPTSIQSLKPYFVENNVILCGFYAGLTVVFALLITMIISYCIFKIKYPYDLYSYFKFTCIAFPLGYALDYFIYDFQIFGPTLNDYYNIVGAGLWGALAFIFSITTSSLILKYYKSLENEEEQE